MYNELTVSHFINRVLLQWSLAEGTFDKTDPMTWITGPRQVGKTFMVKKLGHPYYNWDTSEVKKEYLKNPYFFRSNTSHIIFDEIHKRRDWKKILKGYYDSPTREENFIVTGSGRMDQYKKGGDSLQGRYLSYQLWPLTYDEIYGGIGKSRDLKVPRDWYSFKPDESSTLDTELVNLGGFPKPFLDGSVTKLRRWQDQYLERLAREDVRDFSNVLHTDKIELLARLLPERMMAPISMLSLARDVEVSPVAIKSWLRLFELLYLGLSLKPYHRKIHRAVKMESKWYFYQWTFVEENGVRFENYLAIQLAAALSSWSERGFGRWELFYLRDQDKREVDFLICRDLKPMALIEAKSSFQPFTPALNFYCQKLGVPGFLVYPAQNSQDRILRTEAGWVLPSHRLLKGLFF
jgi:predicted AAA+ superfamily ATPase